MEVVWGCLTDYDRLDTFIPSLVENKCLERRENGALLRQVGRRTTLVREKSLIKMIHANAVQVGAVEMGVKISATCTLECAEFKQGLPIEFCSLDGDGSDGLLPCPKSTIPDAPAQDISFVLVEGDFEVGAEGESVRI